jgi:preprotein translocase subunit SecD
LFRDLVFCRQRGVRASVQAGFGRVFWTLVDTHVAALISCGFLFQFGTGSIRGFAITLFIGVDLEPVHVDCRVENTL